MNKDEFMEYVDENFLCDGSAKRLIRNILDYLETPIVEENEQYLALCELLDGTIGLSDSEIKKIYL